MPTEAASPRVLKPMAVRGTPFANRDMRRFTPPATVRPVRCGCARVSPPVAPADHCPGLHARLIG
jgi:hypothetical protein